MDERGFERATALAEGEVDAVVSAARSNVRTPATNTECVECGEVISVARRMAAPYSERCKNCQEDREREMRRQKSRSVA